MVKRTPQSGEYIAGLVFAATILIVLAVVWYAEPVYEWALTWQ